MTAAHHRRTTDHPLASPEKLDDAHASLLVHRWDPDTGRCAACNGYCPCREAQAAARVLAQAGAWNTVPFTSLASWRTHQEPARAAGGWLPRLPRLPGWLGWPGA